MSHICLSTCQNRFGTETIPADVPGIVSVPNRFWHVCAGSIRVYNGPWWPRAYWNCSCHISESFELLIFPCISYIQVSCVTYFSHDKMCYFLLRLSQIKGISWNISHESWSFDVGTEAVLLKCFEINITSLKKTPTSVVRWCAALWNVQSQCRQLPQLHFFL